MRLRREIAGGCWQYPFSTGAAPADYFDGISCNEAARLKLATRCRLLFGLVLIALEFSNLVQFATFGSRDLFHTASAKVHASAYTLQAISYLMIPLISVLAPGS